MTARLRALALLFVVACGGEGSGSRGGGFSQAAAPAPGGGEAAPAEPGAPMSAGASSTLAAKAARPLQPRFVLQATHSLPVNGAAWSPDGRTLATASGDGTLKIWDRASWRLRATLPCDAKGLWSAAWSQGRIATAGADGAVRVWDATTGTLQIEIEPHAGAVHGVAWSTDGRRLAAATADGAVVVLDPETGNTVHTLRGHSGPVMAVAWSPASPTLASAGQDGTVRLWSGENGEALRTITAPDPLRSLAWSPDGAALAAGGRSRAVRVWNVESGGVQRTLVAGSEPATEVAWSADGRTIATGGWDGVVRTWDAATGEALESPPPETDPPPVESLAFAGGLLAWGRADGTIRSWDPGGASASARPPDPGAVVREVRWTADGRTLRAALAGGGADLWDAETGRLVTALRTAGGTLHGAAWTADAATVATPGPQGALQLRSAATGAVERTLAGESDVLCVAFGPDRERIATGHADARIRIWDGPTGALRATLQGHRGAVHALAWSGDGQSIASGGSDRDVRIWNVRTKRTTRSLAGHEASVTSVVFGSRARTVASASRDGTIAVWDLASGVRRVRLGGGESGIAGMAFAPDGARLALGGLDGRVRIVAADSGVEERVLAGGDGPIQGVAWSRDGTVLAAAGAGIRLHRLSDGETLSLRSFDVGGRAVGLAHSDDGLFAGDDEAFERVLFRVGPDLGEADLVSAGQLFRAFHRPTLVADFLAGRPIEPSEEVREGIYPPPDVAFIDPPTGPVGTDRAAVRVRASDAGGRVAEIRVWVNGARADDGRAGGGSRESGDGAARDETVEAILVPGENEIVAEAWNALGQVRSRRIRTRVVRSGAADATDLHALLLTVDSYADRTLRLSWANADGGGLAAELEQQAGRAFRHVTATHLRDAEVTRARIDVAVDAIARTAKPTDVFVLYVAGHGTLVRCGNAPLRYHFLTHAARRDDASICAEGLSAAAISTVVRRVRAQRQLVLLDTCRSGGSLADLGAEEDLFKRFAQDEGIAVVAASKAREDAGEVADLRHGLFTYALLEGLRGEARLVGSSDVTVHTLLAYLGRKVDSLSRRYFHRSQRPLSGAYGQDFAIARAR